MDKRLERADELIQNQGEVMGEAKELMEKSKRHEGNEKTI